MWIEIEYRIGYASSGDSLFRDTGLFRLSVCPSVRLSVRLSVCLPDCLSGIEPVYLSLIGIEYVCLMYVFHGERMSILSVCLTFCLSVCLSGIERICLFNWDRICLSVICFSW